MTLLTDNMLLRNRLGLMSIPLTGDGLYPFLEEVAGFSSLTLTSR